MHSSGLGCGPLRNWSAAFYQMSTSINQSINRVVCRIFSFGLGFRSGSFLLSVLCPVDCGYQTIFSWRLTTWQFQRLRLRANKWILVGLTVWPKNDAASERKVFVPAFVFRHGIGLIRWTQFLKKRTSFLCKRRVNDASNAFFVLEHMFRFDFNIYRFRDSNWLKSIDIDWRIDSMFAR